MMILFTAVVTLPQYKKRLPLYKGLRPQILIVFIAKTTVPLYEGLWPQKY